MKHDNIVMYNTFMWKYNKNTICDDAIFIASCINEAISDNIQWPIAKEWGTLGRHISKF
jgi:hypothetical protein